MASVFREPVFCTGRAQTAVNRFTRSQFRCVAYPVSHSTGFCMMIDYRPPSQPKPVAHTAPLAMSVTPAMSIHVSARVSIQLFRMCASIVGLPRRRLVSSY
jgi:hypothetical protein